ncbi:hypothetical protein CEXT_305101 [Caerostris extrusa]|uniref:Uncharacterized protein n=1 Tax=Caerostris extrusa TaxID=172846 RepID=A0AAV4P0T0_CAEEX|nr:hypothetical protein CEXT_305101 [Caerostris extrusa]
MSITSKSILCCHFYGPNGFGRPNLTENYLPIHSSIEFLCLGQRSLTIAGIGQEIRKMRFGWSVDEMLLRGLMVFDDFLTPPRPLCRVWLTSIRYTIRFERFGLLLVLGPVLNAASAINIDNQS